MGWRENGSRITVMISAIALMILQVNLKDHYLLQMFVPPFRLVSEGVPKHAPVAKRQPK